MFSSHSEFREGRIFIISIECDGDSFRSDDQLRADTDRQRVLERLGWRFTRIRASEFYAEPDRSFAALVARVSGHGVQLGWGAADTGIG